MHNYEIIICYFIATWLVKCRYCSNISVIRSVRFRSLFSVILIFLEFLTLRPMSRRKGRVTWRKKNTLIITFRPLRTPAYPTKMFFNSRSYTSSCRERTRTLYLSLPPSPLLSLWAALFAKESTLSRYFHRTACENVNFILLPSPYYTRYRYIPLSGRRPQDRSHVRANRGREADRTTNPRVCSCDIERAFTRRVSPDRCDSHKNRQPIIHGELVANTYLASPLFQRMHLVASRNPLHFSNKLFHSLTSLTFTEQKAYI